MKAFEHLDDNDSDNLITPLHHLASIYAHTERVEESISFFKRAIKIAESSWRHGYGVVMLGELLVLYRNSNKWEEGLEIVQRINETNERLGKKE